MKTRPKQAKEPMESKIKVSNMENERADVEGKVVYYFADRKAVHPKGSSQYVKKLVDRGYRHLTHQDLRNGKKIYGKNAKILVEISSYAHPQVQTFSTDISERMEKLVGIAVSPEAFEKLIERIDAGKIAVFLSEGAVCVRKA